MAELEQWCHDATEEVLAMDQSLVFFLHASLSVDFIYYLICMQLVGLAWDEMKHIRQAVGFLV